ncbi:MULTISPECIES: protein kinase domain-containing protein [Micromonospora]|uniref:protein kinase domain-containing protein n=1 Tax=Micromonospora TaxID=1873 RepID=UPI001E359005|nr:caspase family protein [Micromonospora sp. NBRC 110038]
MTDKIAILAGIDSYAQRWTALDCSVHDVEELAAILEMPEYGFRVRTLKNEQATKPAIVRELIEARNSGAKTVVFYFSGHGAATEFGTYLVSHDNGDFDEGVELRKLAEILGSADSDSQALIILDCCHSGAAASFGPLPYQVRLLHNADVQQAFRPTAHSVAVVAACTEQQLAWEERNTGHGVFTHHLLQALLGDAVDHQGQLTANSLYDVVSRNMAALDGFGEGRQKPVFAGHLSGRLVLASGLEPVLPPPLPDEELRQIEVEASDLIEGYNSYKSQFDTTSWRDQGHESCSRRLENIDKWFTKRRATPGLLTRPDFKKSMETLLRYRTELGYVEAGTVIAEGELEERIGEGGFGAVWKVVDKHTGKRVAFKLYHPHEMYDAEKSRRFENGYDAMRLLRHPQVVAVQRYSRCPTGFVMDFIDGPNLRKLEPHAFMEPAALIRLLIGIGETIQHAHQNDVIHRDIKPENIVCEHQENGSFLPYLTDFDLAWFNTHTQRATKTAMGVVYYAAPEQFFAFDPKAALAKTPALDVFSFGQLMFYCFTGRDPDPVRLDVNRETLEETAIRKGLDNTSVLSLCDLYQQATLWDHTTRLQNFVPVLSELRGIEASLLHTSTTKMFDRDGFVAELIAMLSGRPVVPGSISSFLSAAGTWRVMFDWQEKARRKQYKPVLNAHFQPQGKIGLENVPNDQMRRTLNKRLDEALKRHSSLAIRRAGRHGTYEVFVEIAPRQLDREGVKASADIISESLVALSI